MLIPQISKILTLIALTAISMQTEAQKGIGCVRLERKPIRRAILLGLYSSFAPSAVSQS